MQVAVIGAGGVGKCFLEQLQALVAKRSYLSLVYLATSKKAVFDDGYAPIAVDTAVEKLNSSSTRPRAIPDLVEWLAASPADVVLVDNTSSQELADQYPLILSRRINIVTPNKKAFSGSSALWRAIQDAAASSGAHVYHEASVGAGLPVLSTLNELVETGDTIERIEGVFSGTMSFLFNSFAPLTGAGGKWSDEVKNAQALGYTEPDPRDDLNGLDVARKLTILARLAGMSIESPSSFPVESLIPAELESCETAQGFLDRLAQFDDKMQDVKTAAEQAGKVVRFVGQLNVATGQVRVGLDQFDRSHPIASLKGSDNIISFYTKRYGSNPLIIQGAGAGGAVTAMGVTGDLLKLLARRG